MRIADHRLRCIDTHHTRPELGEAATGEALATRKVKHIESGDPGCE